MVRCGSSGPSSTLVRRCGCVSTSWPARRRAPLRPWWMSTGTPQRCSTTGCARSSRHTSRTTTPSTGSLSWTRATLGAHARVAERAAGKVPVLGILKRGGKVYTTMIPNAQASTLLIIVQDRVQLDSVVHTDAFGSYDILDAAGFEHHRINHSKAFAAGRGRHINGIENFWNQAKRHLRKYNGIPKTHFHLFLKECEWRFNYGSPADLLKTLRAWIKLSNRAVS